MNPGLSSFNQLINHEIKQCRKDSKYIYSLSVLSDNFNSAHASHHGVMRTPMKV